MSNTSGDDERWNPYDDNVPSKICPTCHGTCFEDEYETLECEHCDGEGIIYQIHLVPVDESEDTW